MEQPGSRRLIPLQALTSTQSIDAAMLVVRTYFRSFYKIVLPFTLAACVIVYCLNRYLNLISLVLVPVVFLLIAPLGDLLIRRIAAKEWIVPGAITESGRKAIATEKRFKVIWLALGRQLLMAVSIALLFIPLLYFFPRAVFSAEKKYFDNQDSKIQRRVWDELMKTEGSALGGAIIGLGSFWLLLSFLLFVFIDLASSLLFSYPIFLMRFELDAELMYLMFYDPYTMVTATAVMILTYPLIRIAWMLCYINLRVKYDCWDIATSIQREAARLRSTMEN